MNEPGARPEPPPTSIDPRALAALVHHAQGMLFDPVRVRIAEQLARPIREHLDEYRDALRCKGDTDKHTAEAVKRVRLMVRLCRAGTFGKLTPAGTQNALNKLRTPRSRGRGTPRGLATVNHYLHALKAFSNWMVSDYRADRSPCLSLKPYNARTDVRRARRALTRAETLKLIAAAMNGRTVAKIPGAERAITYVLATTTGLRAGVLESLEAKSFNLSADLPTVTVEAAYSKNGRRDTIPLRADVAELVRAYLAGAGRDKKLFRRPAGNGTRALRVDLEAAGIPYCLNGEFADFHAQRHTFVSNLFETGASPKEAQTLARHQDPRLTLGRYAHVAAAALRAAAERLPSPNATETAAETTQHGEPPKKNRTEETTRSPAPQRGE